MRFRLADVLACPVDGKGPLRLFPFVTKSAPIGRSAFVLPCVNFCSAANQVLNGSHPDEKEVCTPCRDREIEEGVLLCDHCGRWFAMFEGIPHLVRDALRLVGPEREFLRRHRERLPQGLFDSDFTQKLLSEGFLRTEYDLNLLEEGEHWGDFFEAYVSVGDETILDIRATGKHPAFYHIGVLERDDRDLKRQYGLWPLHLGRRMFSFMAKRKGGRGFDVGCGGGQFGLEAAYRGLDMVGCDVSPGALQVARRYAIKVGLDSQYVYAEPMNPPFRAGSLDLLLSKDALHHFPSPSQALSRLSALLKPGGDILIYEHVGRSRMTPKIKLRLLRWLTPRIPEIYEQVPIPTVLQKNSSNEDIGSGEVLKAMKSNFEIEHSVGEMMLYYEMEQLFYFAFGKRRWIARLAHHFFYVLEHLLLLWDQPEFVTVYGRKSRS